MMPVCDTLVALALSALFGVGAGADPEPGPQAGNALKALNALTSAASESVAFEEYARRVSEAQSGVDRYLSEPERGSAEFRAALKEAMGFHLLAVAAWRAKLTNRFEDVLAVGRDPRLARCPELQRALARYPLGTTREQDFARGIIATLEIPRIWSCAADRTDQAEGLLREGKLGS